MLARRMAAPAYPYQRRCEDSVVAGQIIADHRVVLMNAPELYCYTIHSSKTFHYQHILGIYNTVSEFVGRQVYEDHLQLLGRRLPSRITLLRWNREAAYRRPQPVPLPDRFIDQTQSTPKIYYTVAGAIVALA